MLAIPELTFPAGSSPTPLPPPMALPAIRTPPLAKGAQTNGSQRPHPILPLDLPRILQGCSQGHGHSSQLSGHPIPCPKSTPHACLTKKGGVKGVSSIDSVLLQEARVGEAALDIPAPLPSCV